MSSASLISLATLLAASAPAVVLAADAASSGAVDKGEVNSRVVPNEVGSNRHDAEIVATVMAVDQHEIQASDQAAKKSLRPEVMQYAKMIKTQHTQDSAKVAEISNKYKIKPAETSAVHEMKTKGAQDLAKLGALNGAAYERAYLDAMVKGHQEVLDKIDQTLLPQANNVALKKQLTDTRGHVAMHLDEAKKLQAERQSAGIASPAETTY